MGIFVEACKLDKVPFCCFCCCCPTISSREDEGGGGDGSDTCLACLLALLLPFQRVCIEKQVKDRMVISLWFASEKQKSERARKSANLPWPNDFQWNMIVLLIRAAAQWKKREREARANRKQLLQLAMEEVRGKREELRRENLNFRDGMYVRSSTNNVYLPLKGDYYNYQKMFLLLLFTTYSTLRMMNKFIIGRCLLAYLLVVAGLWENRGHEA